MRMRTAVGQPQRLGRKLRKVVKMEGSDGQQGGSVLVPVKVRALDRAWAILRLGGLFS